MLIARKAATVETVVSSYYGAYPWHGRTMRTRMAKEMLFTETAKIIMPMNSDFRYFAISEAAPGVNFRQCLGRDPKITSEGAGGRRPPAPSELILVNR